MGRSVYVWSAVLAATVVALAAAAQEVVLPGEVLAWAAVVLAALVGYRAVRLYRVSSRNSQIVVSDLGNSSGVVALDALVPGLSLLARQAVLGRMERLRERVKVASEVDREPGDVLLKATLPSAALDTKLTDLTKALSEGLPENAKPAAQLLSLLISPRGTTVVGRLQMDGDAPGRAGISLEVADIEGLKEPRSDTFWETPRDGDARKDGATAIQAPAAPAAAATTVRSGTGGRLQRIRAWACERSCPDTNSQAKEPADEEAPKEETHVREARALRELGTLYESRGALDQARIFYEEAIKKDPDNLIAREALPRVLSSPRRTPSERYRALLDPVSRWLAAELVRDKMLSELPRAPGRTRHQRKAKVHNFVGSYHTYGDPSQGAFLRAAERELRLAVEEDPNWYLPHANLGDVLSYGGRQREATESYNEALELLNETPPGGDLASTEQRIVLSRSMAQLLSGDPALQRVAMSGIGAVRDHVSALADPDARLLYALACWHAVLARVASEDGVAAELGVNAARARATARRDLADAVARDLTGDLQAWSEKDPDLAGLRNRPASPS